MTKFDSKVVSFQRDASYFHEKAVKNMKNGASLEALELFRKACEQEPDNVKYRLDLAGLYSEMGLFEQASRMFTKILTEDARNLSCLYGMALNLYRQGEIGRAERALDAYVEAQDDDGRRAEAKRLLDEISIAREISRPGDRRLVRAMRLAADACEKMNEGKNTEGARLFARSIEIREYSKEIRALYAHALQASGKAEEARKQVELSLEKNKTAPSQRALWLCAQVLVQQGDEDEGNVLMEKALALPEEGQDLNLRAFLLMDAARYEEAAQLINRLLGETPCDKQLLHMLSCARFNSGMEIGEVSQGWQRILRLDPYDPIAKYYLRALEEGEMPPVPLNYGYAIPVHEAVRRVKYLTDAMLRGEDALRDAWENDEEFRRILEWEIYQKDSRITRLALGILMNINTDETRSILRLFAQRPDVPMKLRLYAMYLVRVSGEQLFPLLNSSYSQAAMPSEEEVMAELTVSEKQMVRLACDYIEQNFGSFPAADIALIWKTYKEARGNRWDPVRRTETGSAALALFYMEMRSLQGDAVSVSKFYACPVRQTAYIAKSIRSIFHDNIIIQ